MPVIKAFNIPGVPSTLDFDAKKNVESFDEDIIRFIKQDVIPQVTDLFNASEVLSDFDTSYLEKASEQGTEANKFFVNNISPILKKLGKEDNPKELLDGIIEMKKSPLGITDGSGRFTLSYNFNPSDISGDISNLVDTLEDNGSFIRSFDGDKKSLANKKRSIVDAEVNFLNNLYDKNPNFYKNIPDVINDIFNEVFNPQAKGTIQYPVALSISGLKGLKGEDLGKVRYAFPLRLPKNEDYINIDEDGSFTISQEGIENIRDDYLSPSRIRNYTRLSAKASDKKDLWLETLSLLLKIADKQKKEGNNIEYSLSGYPKYFNKKEREYKERGLTEPLKNTSRLEVIRKINNTDDGDYKSLNNIANKNRINTPLQYLQKLFRGKSQGDDSLDVGKNLNNIEVDIPYNKINSEFEISNREGLPDVFDVYQKEYLKGSEKNPITERNLQKYLNSQLSEDEIESVKYIDRNLYDGINEKNSDAIMQFFVSDENGNLTLIEPYLEHVSPINDLSKILWEDIFLKMKEEGYNDDIIEKRLKDVIRLLYGEAYIQRSVDDYKLTLQLAKDVKITESDKENLRRGNLDPDILWNRYIAAGHPIPVTMAKMKKDFPDKIPGVTYADIRKDLYENKMIDGKYSLISLLSEYYYDDSAETIKNTKNNFIVYFEGQPNDDYDKEVLSQDDFEEALQELEENDTPISSIILRLNNNNIKKYASKIAKKYKKIKIGDSQYVLNTDLSNKERLIWHKKELWRPSTSPKTKPKGFRFMNEIRDILSPEASKKISKRREEEFKKMLGGKSWQQAAMDSMKMAAEVRQIEEPYKEQLEELAKEIVYQMYPILKDANIEIDAKITDGMKATPPQKEENEEDLDLEQFDISIEEAGVDKRRLLNAITQGAALKGSRSYVLFDEILNLMSDGLREKYDELLNNAYGIYNSDEALAMMLAMMSQGGGGAQKGGEVDIFYDEENDRPVIKATGVTFPILLQEIIKGLYENLAQFGREKSEGETEEDFRQAFLKNQKIRKRTDTYKNELTDISDAPYAFEALLDVYLNTEMNPQRFPEWYKNLVEIVPSSDFKIFIDNVITGKMSDKDNKYVLDTISKTVKDLERNE